MNFLSGVNPMQLRPLALSLAAAGLFSACSGGGSDSPPPPPPATGVTLAGVVARGAALASASVTATCATGSGTSTTGSNGSYSISITTGSLPCVIEAVSSDKLTKLHSVAPATSTGSATANVTPLTELVVAQLTGADPAKYVVVPGSLATLATASAVSAAQTAVASTLTAGGVSTANAGDFISGTLVAANGSTAGNAYDVVLDQLNAKLVASGTTLTTLTTTVAAAAAGSSGSSGSSGTPTTTVDAATLPADLLLKPKAANCASLASGAYRVIKFARSVTGTAVPWPVTTVTTLNLDASTLTLSDPANPGNSFAWTANGNCRYSGADGSDIVVSPAGVIVARGAVGLGDTSVDVTARGTTRMVIGLPVQNVALADLAGSWNISGWGPGTNPAVYEVSTGIANIASSGAVTQFKCGGSPINTPESACGVSTTLLPTISSNSAGGFDFTSTDPNDRYVDRGFSYRAGNGELMLVVVSAYGGLQFGTKVRTLALPAVGELTANWFLDVGVSGVASTPLYSRTRTVVSLNSATGSATRNTASNGSSVTFPETFYFNPGRNGTVVRPAASATASDGTVVVVRESYSLPLKGFGLTAYYLPATSGSGATSNAISGIAVAKQP
jgi:hypothetical protein